MFWQVKGQNQSPLCNTADFYYPYLLKQQLYLENINAQMPIDKSTGTY